MKNLENMNELNEVEMVKVAGGFDWPSIPDPFSDPAPDFYAAGRPLPFPQDRRGNKVPLDLKRDT